MKNHSSHSKLQTAVDYHATFPVMEHFYTIQGEGRNTGCAAYFVRLGGCDVGCVWCDVKESWEAAKHQLLSIHEIIRNVAASGTKNVVITGGEPMMYDLTELTAALKNEGFNLWLETSGAYSLSQKSLSLRYRMFLIRPMS